MFYRVMNRLLTGMTNRSPWLVVAVAAVMVFASGQTISRANPSEAISYEAVIDAGSSGTRLYLYKLQPSAHGPVASLLLEDEPDMLQGLSKYADKPAQAGPGEIGPLLAGLEGYLKKNAIDAKRVSVSVLATAGMRLVDPPVADQIYQSVRQELDRRGYIVRQVRTITGQEEGIFAWVDTNYLKGNLKPGQKTQGIVEIGGASAQVAMAVPATNQYGQAVRGVRVGDVSYNVLSVSYLGLGQNEARRAMVQAVAKAQLPQNPCYPNSRSPDVSFDAFKSRAGQSGIVVAGDKAAYSQACFEIYGQVVQDTSASSINRFPVAQFQSVPGFESTSFVLLASFYHKLRDWKLLQNSRPERALLGEIFGRCVGPDAWQTVSTLQGKGFFAQNACANATYLYTLIFSGRTLALSSRRVEVLDEVNGQPLTWTRGFALLTAGS